MLQFIYIKTDIDIQRGSLHFFTGAAAW